MEKDVNAAEVVKFVILPLHHSRLIEKQWQNGEPVSPKSYNTLNQHCFQAQCDMCHKNNNRDCVSFDFQVIFVGSLQQPLAKTQDLLQAEN